MDTDEDVAIMVRVVGLLTGEGLCDSHRRLPMPGNGKARWSSEEYVWIRTIKDEASINHHSLMRKKGN